MTVRRWTQTTTCQKPWCTEEPRHSTSAAASPDGPAGQVGPPPVSGTVAAKQLPTLTTTSPLCSPIFRCTDVWTFTVLLYWAEEPLLSCGCFTGYRSKGKDKGECPPVGGCNEKRMLSLLPHCGEAFAERMKKVEVWKWCNLSEFIVYYESFTNCTEVETNMVGCYWPNPLAESFIAGVHRRFFWNCSVHRQHWQDPPDGILILLIAVPTLLTLAMTGVVVWRSKRADRVV
nr:receptor activity-modifying protein 3 isoform X1 [Kogia breviceps]